MAERLIRVRVRPARVVVLIDRVSGAEDLQLVIEFYSRIWGGRYSQILPVNATAPDALTILRLELLRPEYVYGVGIDVDSWSKTVRSACQPRGFGQLRAEFVKNPRQFHVENHILADRPLLACAHLQNRRIGEPRLLKLVSCDPSSTWSLYCAAAYGIHYSNLLQEFFHEDIFFGENNAADFLRLSTRFAENAHYCWLDVISNGLHIDSSGPGIRPPTIVLVKDQILDLSLFWNIRAGSASVPNWIIPIPVDEAERPDVLEQIRNWIKSFQPYGAKPNYCVFTSQTVSAAECESLRDKLQTELTTTTITFVDFEPPGNRIPVVVPYEYEANWPVGIARRKLTIQPPAPKTVGELGDSEGWFVDLLRDVKTSRALKELQLPANDAVFDLLNGPCPPTLELGLIKRTGDGTDSINIRATGKSEVINIFLPTPAEILEETLLEYGIKSFPDEKRSSYLPTIKRFGGLYLSAASMTGQRASVLLALAKDIKTINELKGECKLGKSLLRGNSYLEGLEPVLDRLPPRARRIAAKRFRRYSMETDPNDLSVQSLLEHWTSKGVLIRHWRIGPCSRCRQKYFVPSLEINAPIRCLHCGAEITLPAGLPIGYMLHPAVRHSIAEGIIPVVLTGRFLRNLTHRGFFWLPGVKYESEGGTGDIDILACCDGNIVFGECKSRSETAATDDIDWQSVFRQFLTTAETAIRCNADLVVLAMQVDEFPTHIVDLVSKNIEPRIPCLLLNRDELESGRRFIDDPKRLLRLSDLRRIRFNEPPAVRSNPGARTINFGGMTQSIESS
jgi:hypothetical protein